MIILITPTLGWSWPALVPVVTAVAGYMGFKKFTEMGEEAWAQGELTQALREARIVRIPLASEVVEPIAEELGNDEMLTFQREDCTLIFRKDVHGKFHVEILSRGDYSAQQLEGIGREFAVSLMQQFAHSRLVRELDRKGITVISEERNENGDLVLQTRRWGKTGPGAP